jgi:hypothetical protein
MKHDCLEVYTDGDKNLKINHIHGILDFYVVIGTEGSIWTAVIIICKIPN